MKKRTKSVIEIITIVAIVAVLGVLLTVHNELKTKVYIFPESLNDYAGLSVERQIEAINRDNLKEDICTDVYKKKDGSLAIKLNKKQWNWWIENVNGKIKQFEKEVGEKGGKLTVSDDRKSVIFEGTSDFYMEYIHSKSYLASVAAAEYQVLTEDNPEDWEVYLCFKNLKTGEIIADGTLPYDTIEFTNEDLK